MNQIHPCVHSGFCCKQSPCFFGTAISPENHTCAQLVERQPNRFYCRIYDEIKKIPSSYISPAFGAGCCSNLNTDRMLILEGRR